MKYEKGCTKKILYADALVVGSGAASFNAAVCLKKQGIDNVILISSGINRGTSRNTGSDKQTYYKLGLGFQSDAIGAMAQTLFDGGAMDGPNALVEAALSAKGFLHLSDIGVPFPQDQYGCFPGYVTDHDPAGRASSCGPYTSRYMTEKLEAEAKRWQVKMEDQLQVVELLTQGNRVVGVAALDLAMLKEQRIGFVYFLTAHVVYAVGASAGIYGASVYPPSQWGAIGVALKAGAPAVNLTEWQYGIASVHPRWNLSGSYQQIIPRYFSVKESSGEEKEFLTDYFDTPGQLLNATFLKGYQWPFDAQKVENYGSSLIDLAIWQQRRQGRQVYMDFRFNPLGMTWEQVWNLLDDTARDYLTQCGATQETPIDRLMKMNPKSVQLYRDKGRDLFSEPLEIDVCAQHQNGGLKVDHWWRSPLEGLYPIGECAGTHGIRRPGGAALNSGQVGGQRAAQWIAHHPLKDSFSPEVAEVCHRRMEKRCDALLSGGSERSSVLWRRIKQRMSQMCHIRSQRAAQIIAETAAAELAELNDLIQIKSLQELALAFALEDFLLVQLAMARSVEAYIAAGGGSRGSALVLDEKGALCLPGGLRCADVYRAADGLIQETTLKGSNQFVCLFRPVLPIPRGEAWFETAWEAWESGRIYE